MRITTNLLDSNKWIPLFYRCIVRAGRKRGPLTTKIRVLSIEEERAKNVKNKKNDHANTTKISSKHYCKHCNLAFLDIDIRDYHQETAHPEVKSEQQSIENIQIKKRTKRTNTRLSLRLQEKLTLLKMKLKIDPPLENEVESQSRYDFVVKNEEDIEAEQKLNIRNNSMKDTFHSCSYCGYSCKRKYDIKRHISKKHLLFSVQSEDVLICEMCKKTFKTKRNLREHMVRFHIAGYKNRFTKGYCCDRCGMGFKMLHEMLCHRYLHHVDAVPMKWSSFRASLGRIKLCEKCDNYYRDGRFWDEHLCLDVDDKNIMDKILKVEEMKPLFKCDICSVCFLWKWIYRQHREISHPEAEIKNWDLISEMEIPYYCSSCFLSFVDQNAINDHECVNLDLEPKLKSYECDTCGSHYQRRSDFQRHIRNKHANQTDIEYNFNSICKRKSQIQCPYCEVTTITRNGILAHIKEVHNIETDTPFVCITCNKVFKRKATMDTHNQIYHPREENIEETNKVLKEAEILLNGEVAYHCNICNRNMFNSVRFIAHYRLHHLERKFTCDLCGKQTRTQHQLNTHIKIIHLNIRNYECDICKKTFHAKQSCEEHRRIHTGERPYSCEICGKTFIAMNALLTHKKFHNDFFAHPCTMCPKKFKVRRSLINHIRTHTGERPFKCELCPKTFNNSSRFSYHKRVTHSDARPFSCSLCGSCFKANKFLMRHMKLHNIRTHIQFRRRNNPEYFASLDSNKSGKGANQKRLKKDENNDFQTFSEDAPF
ncbi:hypothetical protein PGB90_004744 [Kerria lacca]